MKLDNKFFPAFMAVIAVLTALAIVYSSLSYTKTQKKRFEQSIVDDESLLIRSFTKINSTDSLAISDYKGSDVVLFFWASWSEKSDLLMQELLVLKDERESLEIIGALVLDATDDIDKAVFYDQFSYIDGAKLYNDLKVPGIPSYILFDKSGVVKHVHVGYQEGAGYTILKRGTCTLKMYHSLNNELVKDENLLQEMSRGIMYGDGCFTTLRSYKGKFLHFERHYKRLLEGANYLGFRIGQPKEELKDLIQDLLLKNGNYDSDSVIRIQYSRRGSNGFLDLSEESSLLITNTTLPNIKENISLKTVKTRAIPEASLSRKVKLTNSLNYIKAMQEASKENADDALMLTIDGFVSETTISNVFWIKENQVFTPSEECDLLLGTTRAVVISLLAENQIPVKRAKFLPEDLMNADFVFCCNSVREIISILKIDGKEFEFTNELFDTLKNSFDDYKTKHLS